MADEANNQSKSGTPEAVVVGSVSPRITAAGVFCFS